MQKTIIAAFAVALTAVGAQAATSVSGANLAPDGLGGFNAVPIVDNAGNPVPFVYAAGTFGGATDFAGDSGSIFGAFTNFSSTGAQGAENPSLDGLFGPSYSIQSANLQGVGSPVFILIGNGGTLATSSDYIVLNLGFNLAAEVVGAGSISFNLNADSSTDHTGANGAVSLLRGFGVTVSDGSYNAPFTSVNGQEGITFGVIPEPSTSLLAGLAGLALVVRRRR